MAFFLVKSILLCLFPLVIPSSSFSAPTPPLNNPHAEAIDPADDFWECPPEVVPQALEHLLPNSLGLSRPLSPFDITGTKDDVKRYLDARTPSPVDLDEASKQGVVLSSKGR